MPVFYEPAIAERPVLNEGESHHAVKVLRLGAGEAIDVADGLGNWYRAEITQPHPKHCAVRILSKTAVPPRPCRIHLAIAPTKNLDRVEWMLEKCVEIGLDEISFLKTRFSERRVIKLERLHSVAVSALKQSGQSWLPKMNSLLELEEFLEIFNRTADRPSANRSQFAPAQPTVLNSQRFIAHLDEGERKLLHREATPGGNYWVLVGPEGDFSTEEIRQAQSAGFQAVSLGPSRLRTETAGIVAVHTLNLVNQ